LRDVALKQTFAARKMKLRHRIRTVRLQCPAGR
jgi:hypothetical protein